MKFEVMANIKSVILEGKIYRVKDKKVEIPDEVAKNKKLMKPMAKILKVIEEPKEPAKEDDKKENKKGDKNK